MSKNKTPLDEFTKLLENPSHDLLVEVYTKDKGRRKLVNKPKAEKMTLDKLAKEMRDGFKQVNTRIDRIEKRLDLVEKRLDYNNLKRLPDNH